jgi:hypothetical protein
MSAAATTTTQTIKGVPIPPELAISEAELMSLSVEELEAYITKVSSIAVEEYSSIQGFNAESLTYQTLMSQTQSTIDGLGVEIYSYSNISTALYSSGQTISTNIIALDSTIYQYELDIATADSTIYYADSTIAGLAAEDAALEKQLADSDAAFKAQAETYSSLVYTYLGKKKDYDDHIDYMSTVDWLLASTITADGILTPIYESTLSTFNGIEGEITFYKGEDVRLRRVLSVAEDGVRKAEENRDSTIAAVQRLSSLYEVALINVDYATALSTQTTALELQREAEEMVAKAETLYNNSGNVQAGGKRKAQRGGALTSLQMAQSLLQERQAEVGRQKELVEGLGGTLQKQIDTSYEQLLASIQSNIRKELENISTFRSQKEIAYAKRDEYSSLMEAALVEMRKYIDESTMYTSSYISTQYGIEVLSSLEAQQLAEINSDNMSIGILDITLSSLSTQLWDYMSSLDGWIKVSTIYDVIYKSSMDVYNEYDGHVDSTTKGIDVLVKEQGVLERTITGLEIEVAKQSTIEEREKVRVDQYGCGVRRHYAELERGAYQYKETFLRERRLAAQEAYERLVTEEIQRVSSLATAGNAQAYSALNLESDAIRGAYNTFTTINSYLDAFDTLYGSYNSIKDELQKMEDAAAAEYNLRFTADGADRLGGGISEPAVEAKRAIYKDAGTRMQTEESNAVMLRKKVADAFTYAQISENDQRFAELSSIIIAAMAESPSGASGASGASGP